MFSDIVERVASATPEKPALVSGGDVVTYEELAGMTAHTFSYLRHTGVKAGDVVVLELTNPVDFLCAAMAALDVGCQVLPMPPKLNGPTMAQILFRCKPRLVMKQLHMDSYRGGKKSQSGTMLHLTSGSSGAQKIVVRPMENLMDEASGVAAHLNFVSEGTRVLAMMPLSHSFGCGVWRAVIYAGATLYAPLAQDLGARLVQLRAALYEGMDYMFGVPYLYKLLMRHWVGPSFPCGTRCFAGGEILREHVVREWYRATGTHLQQEYGLGEGGITTLAAPYSPHNSIGVPIPGVEIRIEDEVGGYGELVVYRKGAPSRYFFGESPETFQEDGGIRTGDLGFKADDGYYLKGRKKDIIIVAGMKVVPLEVERAIYTSFLAEDVVVLGMPDDLTGERVVAFVTPMYLNGEVIRQALRRVLESYKVPREVKVLIEMPRTQSGKVDRAALRSRL
ncbi:hypothetical protein LCGC14_0809710 [marine sediment metagenome]|uniref:AMP-dependent synthetase/ligase domain-containing protein n=1 Tax=marine sediment metagenome TaxID=412755 RepID=A0A0F9SUN9_9ZZZZ